MNVFQIIILSDHFQLPSFFVKPSDYAIYDRNLIFEDNIRNLVVTGLSSYMTNISILKIKSHIKYSHVKLDVLRATQHPDEGTVKIRWRIVGGPGFMKLITSIWKFNIVKIFKSRGPEDAE